MESETMTRIVILHNMNFYLSDLQPYEEAYAWWIEDGLPDEADESDYEFIAQDDKLFADVCETFAKICQWIAKEEKGA